MKFPLDIFRCFLSSMFICNYGKGLRVIVKIVNFSSILVVVLRLRSKFVFLPNARLELSYISNDSFHMKKAHI